MKKILIEAIDPAVTLFCYAVWPFIRAYQLFNDLRDGIGYVAQASTRNVILANAQCRGADLRDFLRAPANSQGRKPLIIITKQETLEQIIESVFRRMFPSELIPDLKETARLLKECIRMGNTLTEIEAKEALQVAAATAALQRVNALEAANLLLTQSNASQKLLIAQLQQQLSSAGLDQTLLDKIAGEQATMQTTLASIAPPPDPGGTSGNTGGDSGSGGGTTGSGSGDSGGTSGSGSGSGSSGGDSSSSGSGSGDGGTGTTGGGTGPS